MADAKAFVRKKRGPPEKISVELIEKICVCLRHGAYVETAAASCGLNKDTFYKWMRIGAKAKRGIYKELNDAVLKAVADGELGDIAAISKHRARSWQAAAWRLQRRHPSRWAPTHRPPVAPEQDDDSDFRLSYDLSEDDE